METYKFDGLEYLKPFVRTIATNGLGVGEVAARVCYDSFDKSLDDKMQNIGKDIKNLNLNSGVIKDLRDYKNTELLEKLVWAYHHESIVEHTNVTFLIANIGRGVLQEFARHRIQNLSVRSTRYTMHGLLMIFAVIRELEYRSKLDKIILFDRFLREQNYFIIHDIDLHLAETEAIYKKLDNYFNRKALGCDKKIDVYDTIMSNETKDMFKEIVNDLSMGLSKLPKNYLANAINKMISSKAKRNVGDKFKFIVSDNWNTTLVSTFNLRSLKNFIKLRNSGAAWFQIDMLAKEMLNELNPEMRKLIVKE